VTKRCLFVSLSLFVLFEGSSRYCFNKSLDNIRIGTSHLSDLKKGYFDKRTLSTGIPLGELHHYIKGIAWRTDQLPERRGLNSEKIPSDVLQTHYCVTFRWPSLIMHYRVKLTVDYRQRVTGFHLMSPGISE
jgi:hypothetical protein